jgi:hypothetical protein
MKGDYKWRYQEYTNIFYSPQLLYKDRYYVLRRGVFTIANTSPTLSDTMSLDLFVGIMRLNGSVSIPYPTTFKTIQDNIPSSRYVLPLCHFPLYKTSAGHQTQERVFYHTFDIDLDTGFDGIAVALGQDNTFPLVSAPFPNRSPDFLITASLTIEEYTPVFANQRRQLFSVVPTYSIGGEINIDIPQPPDNTQEIKGHVFHVRLVN